MEIAAKPIKKLALAGLVLAAAICVSASDGRIPIGTAPYTISSPGSYYLTADMALGTGSNLIVITTSNVTIDLDGHTLTNTSTASAVIGSNGNTNIEIRNGRLVGGNYGIGLFTVNGGTLTVDRVKVSGYSFNGIGIVGGTPYPSLQITNNTISTNGGTGYLGMAVDYISGGRIASNALAGNGSGGVGSGIFVYGGTAVIVADNGITAYGTGINVQASSNGVKVLRNDIAACTVGISVSGSTGVELQENLATANTTTGITFSSVTGCVYRDNTAQGNPTNYSIPGSGVTNAGGNF